MILSHARHSAAAVLCCAAGLAGQNDWFATGGLRSAQEFVQPGAGRHGRPAYFAAGPQYGRICEWDGAAWEEQSRWPLAASAQSVLLLVHDPGRAEELAIFHGTSVFGPAHLETWVRNGTSWRQVSLADPMQISQSRIRYFPPRGRLIAWNNAAVHEWDGSNWVPLAAVPPVPLVDFATDLRRNVVIGVEAPATGLVIHEWNGTSWRAAATVAGSPGTAGLALEWDDAAGAVFVHQRSLAAAPVPCWHWNGAQWTAVPSPGGPIDTLVPDPAHGTLRCFSDSLHPDLAPTDWIWDGTAWRQGPVRGGSYSQLQSMDDFRLRVVRPGIDTLEWDGQAWSLLAPTPASIVSVDAWRSSFDWGSGSTILAGHDNGTFQTWLWNGAAWSAVLTTPRPPARQRFALVRDPSRPGVVLFGGEGTGGQSLADTWVWAFGGWSQVATSPTPAAGVCWSAESQSARNPSAVVATDGVWRWAGGWQLLADLPPLRSVDAATVQPDGSVLVLGTATVDTAAFRLTNGVWQRLFGPYRQADWVGGDPLRSAPLAMSRGFGLVLSDLPAADREYGAGCGATVPVLGGEGLPRLATADYTLAVYTEAQAPVFLALANRGAALSLGGGCTQWVAQIDSVRLAFADARGRAGFTTAVPNDPALRGLDVFAQAAVLLPATAGIAFTAGLRVTVGD